MNLLIPGSLPPKSVAADLLPYVMEHCPELVRRLSKLRPVITDCPPQETGCSALEFFTLQNVGFSKQDGLTFGAGLGPLRAGMTQPSDAVWIADLCSVAIGRDGAALAQPESLCLAPEHADALFEAALPLWSGSGISVLPIAVGRWRVWLGAEAQITSISPAAVSTLSVSDWWPQSESLKTWRKLLNEVQMLWHTHAINDQRVAQGLEPINSLWLYGGASGWAPSKQLNTQYSVNVLEKSFLEKDWATWLAQLPALSTQLSTHPDNTTLTLIGEDRIIALSASQQSWWKRLGFHRVQHWTDWWTLQN